MKQLENRTEDSKRELDIIEAIEDIKDRNNMLDAADLDGIIKKYENNSKENEISEEEIKLISKKFKIAMQRRQNEKLENNFLFEGKVDNKSNIKPFIVRKNIKRKRENGLKLIAEYESSENSDN